MDICENVVKVLREEQDSVIEEIQDFLGELLQTEEELFSNISVPFASD